MQAMWIERHRNRKNNYLLIEGTDKQVSAHNRHPKYSPISWRRIYITGKYGWESWLPAVAPSTIALVKSEIKSSISSR